MASIRKESAVDAPAEHVWEPPAMSAVHARLAQGLVRDTRLDGDSRLVAFAGGTVVHERIVEVDDRARGLAYAVDLACAHHTQ